MESSFHFGIIGAGAIGGAIGSVLKKANLPVEFWDRTSDLRTKSDFAEFCRVSNVFIICVPSWVVPEIADELIPQLPSQAVIITVAKGTLDGFVTLDQLLAQKFPGQCYGLLYGPMLADEIKSGKSAYTILSLSDKRQTNALKPIFDKAGIYVSQSDDMHTVAVCGVLKNIYALAFGIHDGLGLGANSKGALTVRTVAEMIRILHQLQLDINLAISLAGLGDLLATGWSESSYNHRIGQALASGSNPDGLDGEGVHSLHHIQAVLSVDNFPILSRLTHIVINKAPAETFREVLV